MKQYFRPLAPLALIALLLGGCSSLTAQRPDPPPFTFPADGKPLPFRGGEQAEAASEPKPQPQEPRLYPGNDRVVKLAPAPKPDPVLQQGDAVSLNFENAPLGEVIHALLGDLLKLNYTIDQGADVTVSLRTQKPLPRAQVLDVLDTLLLPHGLTLVRDPAGVYHVTARDGVKGGLPVIGAGQEKLLPGAGVLIAPLKYIGAAEMAKVLEPLAPEGALVRVDTVRNLLVLQGSKAQLEGWMQIIDTFDVDFLAGLSVGVFPLEHASVSEVKDAVALMLGQQALVGGADAKGGAAVGAAAPGGNAPGGAEASPLSGLVKVLPIERLNALLVVTSRRHYLDLVRDWLSRLDRPADNELEPRLFVYPVQNASAVHLAELLNGLFGAAGQGGAAKTSGVAPGLAPTRIGGAGSSMASTLGGTTPSSTSSSSASSSGSTTPTLGAQAMQPSATAPGRDAAQTSVSQLEGNVRVVADEKRNALIIRAPRKEYRRIEAALRELDKAQTQVLIEASIVEVTLTDSLKYGLEWYLQNGLGDGRTGTAQLNMRASGNIGPTQPGFSYTVTNSAGVVRAALNALADKSLLRVLSNPSLLVLDNHTATIQVGQQQPIKNATTVSSQDLVTESITYKDTGVMLSVTPSVNAGGLVTMDIVQQVTDVGDVDAATGQRSFMNRQIQSRIAVRSGESIVLGGLIRDNESNGRSGVPVLSNLPVIGALFSTTNDTRQRTELLVLLTPRALENDDALRQASQEMRERMRGIAVDVRGREREGEPGAAPPRTETQPQPETQPVKEVQ